MGRREHREYAGDRLRCFRLRMSSCGCYDDGGAYWGCGTPLYCIAGDETLLFQRAHSRKEAFRQATARLLSTRMLQPKVTHAKEAMVQNS